jgi:hypothetical protein
VTQRHQRRTAGLRGLLERVALALAGLAGARLAGVLGAVVSRFTLIRLIRALPDPEIGQVTILGVDDSAKRKGHSYATVLLDMESHRPVDLLPDRKAGTFAGWLKAHPGVRVICRDRAGAYASGGREGAPDAVQVADRFHLWQNLGEAVEKAVFTHRADLREPAPEAGEAAVMVPEPAQTAAPLPEPDGYRDVCGRERRLVTRHRERHAAAHARLAAGMPAAAIARDLSLDRHTVDRFAHAASLEESSTRSSLT